MEDQKQTESLDQGATNDSSSSSELDATVSLVDITNGLTFHNDDTHNKSKVNYYEEVSGRMNKILNEDSGSEVNGKITDDDNYGINETTRTDGSNKLVGNKKDNETVSLCADGTVDAPMTCPNESPEAYEESYGKKKKGLIAGFLQGVYSFQKGTKNKQNKTHIPSSQPKQPSVTNSIEEDVKPHDDKKSASSNEKHMFNLGFLQKTKSNKKKATDISDSQAKEAPDACRDSMPIQDKNKQWKKKHQQLLNQALEEKKSNATALNETTAILRARDRELKEYRADISQLTAQIQQLQEDKSDLLLSVRLTKAVSAKLTQNNPNIADLSDANRPTKLAKQFSEFYDNEYTDAIEELKEKQGIEEQTAIESMLTLLQETDEVRIEIQLPDEHRKSLSDIRRLCATKVEEDCCSMSKIIASKIAFERGITPESGPKTLAYITKCAKLCWYMVIKEPPVLVGFHAVVDGEPFNKDMYRSYTKAGELLDFIVWPPLYLHKDGPLLCKGVAQGK